MLTFRGFAPAVLTLTLLAASAPAFGSSGGETGADLVQFDFYGFSVAPDPTDTQNIGDEFEMVGVINPSTTITPVPLDPDNNEYTVHISGLILESVVVNGPLLELHYEGGTLEIYEDSRFNAPFGPNTDPSAVPPLNPAEVPANFIDGELLVKMDYRNYITLWYDPAGIGTIAFTNSELRVVGGSGLPYLQPFLVIGWHNGGGFTNSVQAQIPAGYGMRYDALVKWESPLAIETKTWGSIKAHFR